MSLTINAATPPVLVEQSAGLKASDSKAKVPITTAADTATISSAALNAAKGAIQEATETPAQTKKEANRLSMAD